MLHHGGAEAAGAGDMPGLRRAGRTQSCRGSPPRRWKALSGAEAGKGKRERLKRQRPGRHRAIVDRALIVGNGKAGEALQPRFHLALHRMGRHDVAARLNPERTGCAQESGVLAGAVVVHGRSGRACARQRLRGGSMHRPMRAAFQCARVEPGRRQHAERRFHVRRLAAVRRTGERQMRVGEREALGCARFDQHQRLQRLHGRARIDQSVDVAQGQHRCAVGIDHRYGAAVAAFDVGTADGFDEDRIGHWELTRCMKEISF
jgi:hypothetical protein